MTAEKNNTLYRYEGAIDSATVSLYPSLRLPSDALQIDVPEVPSEEKVYTVRNNGSSAYRWLQMTSRRFSEIFITVSSLIRNTATKVRRFIRCAVSRISSSLTFRQTVCLRL
ncbi:MAG: hypothetical protein E7057_07215 [Lentisphaerae bacterium]|nr:hypothetical protein [Lentisphaerota bacterium]